jgi:phosphotransferase system HPr (HPr) family protein
MSNIHRKTVTIINELGLHARAATLFVKVAADFKAELVVEKGGREVNGKSIMGLLTLLAAKDSQIELIADGADGAEQIAALEALIQNRFMEDR